MESLKKLAAMRGFEFCEPMWEIPLHGSPERALFRMPVKTDKGIFVLERFSKESLQRKKNIAETLHQLKKGGMSHILPPLGRSGEDSLFDYENTPCQLTPYISGTPLERPSYVNDAWRGASLADFLADLRQNDACVPDLMPEFSLLQFVKEFLLTLEKYDVAVYAHIFSFWKKTEEKLRPIHKKLSRFFCHGDLHCLNAIWGEKDLLFVIDWEFCGKKEENYDMANFLGCVGVEDPKALDGPLVEAFLSKVAENGLLSQAGWDALVPMTIASRFAWLSEWLREGDEEMIALETDYLALLTSKAPQLHTLWNSVH
ncbi:aminoglycoside phosphotransferase family protein [Desulfococcaceae bacterium OttesenSCG-928-F15]|nr:aminoglycoside phosphotransferase family protein [Desulfococcaceae bacterium OttesenSCG-928-F15]